VNGLHHVSSFSADIAGPLGSAFGCETQCQRPARLHCRMQTAFTKNITDLYITTDPVSSFFSSSVALR
jgi:hypothetical protein